MRLVQEPGSRTLPRRALTWCFSLCLTLTLRRTTSISVDLMPESLTTENPIKPAEYKQDL